MSDHVGEPPGGQVARPQLVDCDIHPPGEERIIDYVGETVRDEFRRRVRRHPGWVAHVGWFSPWVRDDLVLEGAESALDLLRADVLDKYEVGYGILTGTLGPINQMIHRLPVDLAAEGARASNDWLIAEWLDREPRLLGTLVVPWEYPDIAVGEIRRRSNERRWAQVMIPAEALEPLGSRKYWPIYEAATASGFPLVMHIGFFEGHNNGAGYPSFMFERYLAFAHSTHRQLLNMVCEGLFDAVPGLRVVLVEGGVSWAVSLRWALDSAFDLLRDDLRLDRKPSEYLDDFVWFTTQPVEEPDRPEHLAQAFDHGHLVNRVMFSTDWPHWDFDAPGMALPRALPEATRSRIFAANACALYGLPR